MTNYEILLKYNNKKDLLSFYHYNSVKYKYIKQNNVILAFLYKNIIPLGKYEKVILFDKNKKAYHIKNDKLEEINKNRMLNILFMSSRHNPFAKLKFRKMFNLKYIINKNGSIKLLDDLENFYIIDEENENKIDDLFILNKYKYKDFKNKYKLNISNPFILQNKKVKYSIKMDILNNKSFIIRIFLIFNKKFLEIHRIYVNDKSIDKYRINNFGNWIKTNLENNIYNDFNFNLNNCSNTNLNYCKDIFKDYTKTDKINLSLILEFIQYPEIEQLYKMGLNQFILTSLGKISNIGTNNFFNNYFYFFNTNQNTIYNKFGLNKYQFNIIKKEINDTKTCDILMLLRNIYSDDISNLDNTTFDDSYVILKTFIKYKHINKNMLLAIILKLKSFNKEQKFIIKSLNHILKISNINNTQTITSTYCNCEDIIKKYINYLNYLNKLKDLTDLIFELKFDDYSDLCYLEKEAILLYEKLIDEKRNKKFKKQTKKLKNLTRTNEDYLIIYPKNIKELVREGEKLNHCVGDYIDSIINKEARILFLRKKENPNKPFFTIELCKKKNKIKQIHGFDNCDIKKGSKPYKFIKEWAKDNNLKFGDIDELYTAD